MTAVELAEIRLRHDYRDFALTETNKLLGVPQEIDLIAQAIGDCGKLLEEVAVLQQWVADLQSGIYVNCVYCGHRYGPEDKVSVSMAQVLTKHVATCPKHPMSKLLLCCKAADHAYSSLLAVREGLTDEFLHGLRETTREAIAYAGA